MRADDDDGDGEKEDDLEVVDLLACCLPPISDDDDVLSWQQAPAALKVVNPHYCAGILTISPKWLIFV